MSKEIFRFLRGELNGFYLKNFYATFNKTIEELKLFFVNLKNTQFEEGCISDENLFGLGKFAGIFLPRVETSDSVASLYMTESEVVEDVEYSERGLFSSSAEQFAFYHLSEEETGDINTLATNNLRSSLIGDEEVVGYIASSNDDVLDANGNVKSSAILSSPPVDEAYTEYYGNKFLFLAEGSSSAYTDVDSSLYMELYKALQIVRYNGASIKSLCDIISILCPEGMIRIKKIELGVDGKHVNVYYVYNSDVGAITYRQQRLALLDYIVGEKFKQVTLVEN